MADLLLELFSEEIPARMQHIASQDLANAITAELRKLEFSFDDKKTELFVTPRRLGLILRDLPVERAASSVEVKGPKANAPEAAVEGFLKKNNLTRADLTERDGVFFAQTRVEGRKTADALKDIIEKTLANFPWPKSMRWGSGEARWVRPLHSILCLFDGKVVPVAFAGVTAGNETHGHRFLASEPLVINNPDEYEAKLKKAFVIADADERKIRIREKIVEAAAKEGLSVRADEGLLAEVTGLVEWPVILLGTIDAQYMDLPPEVLVSEMRGHQKYFALNNKDGSLSSRFVITANMETNDGGKAIIAGNERVLRARLADGRFFWDQDRKKKLEDWAEGLKTVTYHAKLGTIAEKVERVAKLAVTLATSLRGAAGDAAIQPSGSPRFARDDESLVSQVERAALLAKADLVTGMVGEFPELQGVMGRYYAQGQGECVEVADAIRDHYKPLGPTDSVPTEPTAVCVALADKMDTLIGMFSIGEKPTGSKDPFALRRAALGVIRIILENELRISCGAPLARAQDLVRSGDPAQTLRVSQDLTTFILDRLKVQLKEQGIRHDIIDAVTAQGDDDLVRIVARAKALQSFLGTEDGANLLAAYKRASNILSIEEKKDKMRYDQPVQAGKLAQAEEQSLHAALEQAAQGVRPLLEKEQFTESMSALSRLRKPVDSFFDKVLVNDKDPENRKNRLNLLAQLRATLDSVAHFTAIEA